MFFRDLPYNFCVLVIVLLFFTDCQLDKYYKHSQNEAVSKCAKGQNKDAL